SFVSIPMIANHFDKNKEMIIPEPYERVLPPVTYITDLPKPKPDLPEKQATQISAVDVKKDVAATITENTTTDEEMLSRDEVQGLVTGNVDVEGQEGGSYMATSPGNENVTGSGEGNPNGVEDGQNILKTFEVDRTPEFPGGLDNFYKSVSRNFKIPDINKQTTMIVYVSFVVEPDGSLSDIHVMRDP